MKILHILDHSLPLHSGYTFRSRNIFLCQRALGMEPVVLTSPKHEESHGEAADRECIDDLTYYRSGTCPKSLPVCNEFRIMQRLRRRMLEVACMEQPDIIHAHSPVLNGLPALQVGKLLNVPVVYEIRAFWEDAAVDHGTCREGSPRYRMIRWLETRVCRQADAIVPICRGLEKDLLGRTGIDPAKLHVVGNAIDAAGFVPVPQDQRLASKWGIDGNDLIMGFIGSFYHYEGLALLLEAFPDMLEKCPNLKLLFVGGGPMEKRLRRIAAQQAWKDRVVFTGRIPHEQVPGAYALVDILVFPRLSMRLTETVTPLKPLEAMAMGKAILASDVGGHEELIEDGKTGVLFQAGNQQDLSEKALLLASSEAMRNKLGGNGRRFVCNKRTWKTNGMRYQQIYKALCRGRLFEGCSESGNV